MKYFPDLYGGSQDGELRRLSPGLVGLQDLLDEPFDLPLRHAVAVSRLPEDVNALGQFVVDARLTHRRSHDGSGHSGFSVKHVDLQLLRASGAWCHLGSHIKCLPPHHFINNYIS